jgi:cytochrome d ubiquinol oxidase subunit I
VNPWQALFANTYLWHELIHMYLAGYIVTGFVLAAAYSVGKLRGRWGRYERTALAVPLTIAALAAPVQVLVGDWAGREVAKHQPAKLAAVRGACRTRSAAPRSTSSAGTPTTRSSTASGSRRHCRSSRSTTSTRRSKGLNAFPYRAPVNVVRVAFQTMVGIGTLLALLGVIFLFVRWRRGRLPESPWFYGAVALAGPASVVALIAGWVVTEVGRQPWVVYGVMKTDEAVTGAKGIPVGYARWRSSTPAWRSGSWWILRRLAAMPLKAH